MAEAGDAVAEWTALLDRLEHDLVAPSPGWAPARTPLPVELADRARRLLAAQGRRIAELTREQDETRAQLTALRSIPAAPAERAAYLDLDG